MEAKAQALEAQVEDLRGQAAKATEDLEARSKEIEQLKADIALANSEHTS